MEILRKGVKIIWGVVLYWRSLFRRLLFLPIVFVLSLMLCKADGMVQYLNKITDSIKISVTKATMTKSCEQSVKFKVCDKSQNGKKLVDLNTAETCELDLLPGIGEKLAKEIVIQRGKMKGFYSVEDVLCTPGIGLKTLAKIKDMVTVTKK